MDQETVKLSSEKYEKLIKWLDLIEIQENALIIKIKNKKVFKLNENGVLYLPTGVYEGYP